MRSNQSFVHRLVLLSFMLVLNGLIVTVSSVAKGKPTSEPLALDEINALTEAYYRIKSSYVEKIDDATLIRAAINGMVNSLDRHSRYLPPEEFARFNTDNEGEYAGIGLTFNDHKYGIEIEEVLNNSPAKRAGLKSGMLVTHINATAIKLISAEDAFQMLKGEAGSSVTLTVASSSFPKPKEITLVREIILLESVSSQLLPGKTGYVAVSQFTLHSVEEFSRAVLKMSNKKKLKNLIIDLRDNPGGVMEIAVEMSDLFVTDGKLLISSGRTQDANEVFYANKKTPFKHLNVVVMINQGSASASEILAAALQDHGKALIFGENSYGKGSIQSIYSLNKLSGMKLTTAAYFSPKGHPIQDVGVKPDVNYAEKDEKNDYNVTLLDDPQVLQAYHLLLKHH